MRARLVLGLEARHQRDGDLDAEAPRPSRAVSPSFHERKLRPSSASTAPLTTPPKRVAIPPASTTCATRPAASASTPAARAASHSPEPGSGQRHDVAVRGRLDRAAATFDAGDSSPEATAAREPLERLRVEPEALEHRARARVELVEDHRAAAASRGSDSAYGAPVDAALGDDRRDELRRA